MSNSKLIINFIQRKKRQNYYDSFIFLDKTYKIKDKTLSIDIEDKYFNNLKEKIIVDFKLIATDILDTIYTYKINIYYGINKAYCFISEDNELLIEYNYIDEQKIFYHNFELDEYDGNGLVKRLVLINTPSILNSLQKNISFLSSSLFFSKNLNSLEIIDCDYSNLLFGI